jgi:putative phosphotransacetylase
MKVLTEESLRAQFKKQAPEKYVVDKKAIITPSAKEYLADKNVELVIQDDIGKNGEIIIEEINNNPYNKIPVEASGRHIHLSQEDMDSLFGQGYEMTVVKELSQPGQYQYKERVTLIGPKGTIQRVAILGPVRGRTQIEISLTDAVVLGIKPPIRESGDLDGAEALFVSTPRNVIKVEEGVIVAKRHIHMTEEDAKKLNVKDKDIVKVKINSKRPVIFEEVVVRANKNYKLSMHIDYDEANAVALEKGTYGEILY